MSKEKREHHDENEHDQQKHQDTDAGHDSSHDASDHARAAPDSGVRSDTRWGDAEEMSDIKGRILGISIVGGQTELLISAGRTQGVHVGMTGYLMGGDSYVAQLDIVSVGKRACKARVDATPDYVRAHQDNLLINPSSVPQRAATPAHDYKSRVLSVSVEGGKTKIMLAGGSAQGVAAGMKGVLLDDSGHKIVSFTIEESHSRHTVAYVETIVSEVYRSKSATINPAS